MLNIPNTLTLLRIAAIPAVFIALDEARFGLAFLLFLAAGITDGLDGGIARMTNTKTELGAYLDPLADKGLVLTLLFKLTSMQAIPTWILTIILTRDVVCMGGYFLLFFLTGDQIEIRPTWVGKTATALQLLGIGGLLIILWQPQLEPTIPAQIVLGLSAAFTAVAGLQYVSRGLQWYQTRPAA